MRIIWLKSDYIVPPDSGGKIRTYNLLRHLNQLCEVEYVSFKPEPTPHAEPRMLECARRIYALIRPEENKRGWGFYGRVLRRVPSSLPYIVHKYRDQRFLEYQRARIGDGGKARDTVVVCDFLEMAENVAWDTAAPKVLFQHNVESVIWDRYFQTESHPLKRIYFDYERRRMARYERRACDRFDLVMTVSQRDLERLRDDFQVKSPLTVIDTGVDAEYFQPQPAAAAVPGRLLFLGSLDWMPNIDGVRWFVSDVYPLIRRQRPHVSLQIVGRRPDPSIAQSVARDPSIELVGEVSDVRPYVAQSDIVVVPLRIGGGSRLKIFEAMAMRKPVVSTTIGAEGLPVHDQLDIALADTPIEFSERVVGLLDDPVAKDRMAASGHQLVTENYTWQRIARDFHDQCQQLVRTGDCQEIGC